MMRSIQRPFSSNGYVHARADWIASHARVKRSMTLLKAHAPSRRGIHEITLVDFCCDRRNGAGSAPRRVRHLRRGRCAAASPCGTGGSMSRRLLARPCRAGLLDTTGPAGSVWRMPASLSPWATRRLVLGGLRWLRVRQQDTALRDGLRVEVMTARGISIALAITARRLIWLNPAD